MRDDPYCRSCDDPCRTFPHARAQAEEAERAGVLEKRQRFDYALQKSNWASAMLKNNGDAGGIGEDEAVGDAPDKVSKLSWGRLIRGGDVFAHV